MASPALPCQPPVTTSVLMIITVIPVFCASSTSMTVPHVMSELYGIPRHKSFGPEQNYLREVVLDRVYSDLSTSREHYLNKSQIRSLQSQDGQSCREQSH
jgi:hypothetical protein